jgi:hypothetical protein
MDYDRSRIMARGHEIARGLDTNQDYNEMLSRGLTRAWAEAKARAREQEERRVERQRERYDERLRRWQEERERETTKEPALAVTAGESDTHIEREVDIGDWKILAYYEQSRGRYMVTFNREGNAASMFHCDDAGRQRKAFEWVKSNVERFDSQIALMTILLATIKPDQKDYHTAAIARGLDRSDLENDGYLNRWICN